MVMRAAEIVVTPRFLWRVGRILLLVDFYEAGRRPELVLLVEPT